MRTTTLLGCEADNEVHRQKNVQVFSRPRQGPQFPGKERSHGPRRRSLLKVQLFEVKPESTTEDQLEIAWAVADLAE